MSHALFDVLLGRYQSGQPVGRHPFAGELQLSIRDHLQRLLNGRKGALPHLPSYGMPDVAALFEALPYSRDELTAAVCQAIEQYENRLLQLQVRPRPATLGAERVCFDILGRSRCGQTLKYVVSLYSSGQAQIDLQTEGTWHE